MVGRGKSRCKVPEAGLRLAHSSGKEASAVERGEWGEAKAGGRQGRVVQCLGGREDFGFCQK